MDFRKIKKDFPLFAHYTAQKKPLVYLDSAASYQKPQVVIDAIATFYSTSYANVHRGLYDLSEQATNQYETVRQKVAEFINADHPEEIIFTKGTTEGINLIAESWAVDHLQPGDEIVLTQVEHHANLLPWQRVAQKTGAVLKFIPLNMQTLTLDYTPDLITAKTKLVAITLSSNVLPGVWGADKITLHAVLTQARNVGAKILLDAAQAVAHEKVDIKNLQPDFLVFSGHKMLGPTGVGVLFIKKALHDQVKPYQVGGTMVYTASYDTAQWEQAPKKFEAGTPPISSVIGLGAAIDYLNQNINFKELANHETMLCQQLLAGLRTMPEVTIVGNQEQARHLICLTVASIHAHDLASYVGTHGIATRAGHHCAQPLATLLGTDALLRVSFGMYNTPEDVAYFLEKLKEAVSFFKQL